MVALATAFVRLRLDTSTVRSEVERGLRDAGGDGAAQSLGRRHGEAYSKGFGNGGSTFARVASVMASRTALLTGAVAAATPVVVKFTAAVAPAAGAVVALPATFAAATAASATFKVATSQLSDTISKGLYGTAKQYSAALEDLPPAAQSVAKSVVGLKGEIQSLRQSVAQRFFAPLVDDLGPLTKTYLPLAKREMGDLGGKLGQFGSQVAETARSAPVLNAFRDTFRATGQQVDILRGGISPLGTALAGLVSGTLPLLLGMSQATVGLTERFAAWVEEANRTGRLITIWNNAVTTLRDLKTIIFNLGAIARDVFGYSNVSSETFLATLVRLTTQARLWVDSSQGARVLGDVFDRMSNAGTTFKNTVGGVLPQIAESFRIGAPAAAAFATALSGIIVSLGPILPALTGVSVELLTALIPAMNAFAGWLSRNQELLQTIAPVIVGYLVATKAVGVAVGVATIAQKAWTTALALSKVGQAAWTAVAWLSVAPTHAQTAATKIATSTAGTWIGVKALELAAWVRSTAATVASTAATVANRIATSVSTGVTTAFTAVKSLEIGAWIRATAAAVASTASMVAQRVAMVAGTVATGAITAAQWLWNAALTANPIGLVVAAIALFVGALIYAYKHSETFRKIVDQAWFSIRTTIKYVVDWVVGTAWPWLKQAWTAISNGFVSMKDGIVGAWNAVRNAVASTYNWIKSNVFDPISNLITNTIPGAFNRGIDMIGNAWKRLEELARKPVAFVVNSVINPLIGGFNTISKVIPGVGTIDKIAGFAAGGRIPGAASGKDNRLASVYDQGRRLAGTIKVATGEFITKARSTTANLPVLQKLNSLGRPATHADLDPYLDGGDGRGRGDGIGDLFDKIKSGLAGVGEFITNPREALLKIANSAIGSVPGGGQLRQVLTGMGRKVTDAIGAFLRDKLSGGSIGGGGIAGGFRGMQAAIAKVFPGLSMISGYRPGSRTLSGNTSYHASGRAVDYPPVRALAAWIRGTFGARTKELITPWQDLNLHNGQPHTYTGAIWNQHNFAGGNAHVHWAAALGGLIGRIQNSPMVRLLDRGGAWPSGQLGLNASGHTETVLTGGPNGDMAELASLLREILAAVRASPTGLADALTSNTRRAVQIGRGRPTTIIGQAI